MGWSWPQSADLAMPSSSRSHIQLSVGSTGTFGMLQQGVLGEKHKNYWKQLVDVLVCMLYEATYRMRRSLAGPCRSIRRSYELKPITPDMYVLRQIVAALTRALRTVAAKPPDANEATETLGQ